MGGAMRGQLSVEMLVVLVVILGVVALIASVLMKSATQAAGEADKSANATIGECVVNGERCSASSECCSYFCNKAGECARP